MGKSKRCDVKGLKKGIWTEEEDRQLLAYVKKNGEGGWRLLPQKAGLLRCGKSCRLRWANYLRPGIRRGEFSHEEEETIIRLHASLGNRWATIARHLYRRTDNEVKNYWNTRLKKRLADSDTTADDSSADENPFDATNPTHDGAVSFGKGEDSDASASPAGEKNNIFGSDDLLNDEAIASLALNSPSPTEGSANFDLVCPSSSLEGTSPFSSRATSGNFTTNTLNKIASKMSKFNLQIRPPPCDSRSPVVEVVESPTTSNNVDVIFNDYYTSVLRETTIPEVFQGQLMEFHSPIEDLLQSEDVCNVHGFYDIFDAGFSYF